MGIKQFNKIINLYFLDKDGNQTEDKILCPKYGRKPNIEFVGTFQPSLTGGALPAFTVTVTNLYIDLIKFQYPKIMVEAGYAGNLVSFTGEIISMFTESPGPDGKTVISCYLGTVQKWLNAYVSVSFESGATLKDIVEKTAKSLGFDSDPQIPESLQSLSIKADFAENGNATYVLNKLFKLFPNEGIQITEINGKLYVYSTGANPTGTKKVKLDYLISPPQKNPGDDDGAFYTVFTAPWNPDVQPGTKVDFPAWQYIKFTNLVNAESQTNTVVALFVQVHFSTVGSINQMQIQGLGVSE